jgi:hypothetical protein
MIRRLMAVLLLVSLAGSLAACIVEPEPVGRPGLSLGSRLLWSIRRLASWALGTGLRHKEAPSWWRSGASRVVVREPGTRV